MVRLVDDEDVPIGREGLLRAALVAGEQIDTAENELIVEKGIVIRIGRLDRIAAFLVENVEPQVEPAQEFREPLVNERLGHEDQRALNPAGLDQAMKDQARFDGFPQSDFIGEQNPRDQPAGHLGSNVKLVRNEVDAPPDKSAHLGFAPTMLVLQRGKSQIENLARLDLPIE